MKDTIGGIVEEENFLEKGNWDSASDGPVNS